MILWINFCILFYRYSLRLTINQYVPYTSPHWPLHALEEDIYRHKGRFRAGWNVLREERYQRMIEMGLIRSEWKLTERDSRIPPWKKAVHKEWQMWRMEVYAAQIDRMDQGSGRIVSQLKRDGELDNTLIFFLADNGGCAEELTDSWMNWLYNESHICPRTTREGQPVIAGNKPELMPGPPTTFQSYGVPWANVSNTPFRLYKHWSHEGGVATPLIMHWPAGIKAKGEFRDCPGHLIDIMATCVDVSGAYYPAEFKGNRITPMEGKSLVSVLHSQTLERDGLYFDHEGNRAVHRGKWKLVAKGEKGVWQLYDMEADRTETNNLASGKPELVKQLAVEWKAWAERTKVLPGPWKKGEN
ncbi:MAG: sulfatase-like hydrolase/transferase [bacterium]